MNQSRKKKRRLFWSQSDRDAFYNPPLTSLKLKKSVIRDALAAVLAYDYTVPHNPNGTVFNIFDDGGLHIEDRRPDDPNYKGGKFKVFVGGYSLRFEFHEYMVTYLKTLLIVVK